MDILNFYNAEFLWPYVTGEKDIPRNDCYTNYYRVARDFGRLCAITSLQKATSNPSKRPIDYEFVDIYNGITEAILTTLEMGQSDLSMGKLNALARNVGPTHVDFQSYKKGLDVVLKGDINGVYIQDTSVVDEERRYRVIGSFGGCLKYFNDFYGINETRKITNVTGQSEISCKRHI